MIMTGAQRPDWTVLGPITSMVAVIALGGAVLCVVLGRRALRSTRRTHEQAVTTLEWQLDETRHRVQSAESERARLVTAEQQASARAATLLAAHDAAVAAQQAAERDAERAGEAVVEVEAARREAESVRAAAEQAHATAERAHAAAERDRADAEAARNAAEAETIRLANEAVRLRSTQSELLDVIDDARRQAARHEAELATFGAEIAHFAQIRIELAECRVVAQRTRGQLEVAESNLESLRADVVRLEGVLDTERTASNRFADDVSALGADLAHARMLYDDATRTIDGLRSQRDALSARVEELQRDVARQSDDLDARRAIVDDLEQELAHTRARLDELIAAESQRQSELSALSALRESDQLEIDALRRERDGLLAMCVELRAHTEALAVELSRLRLAAPASTPAPRVGAAHTDEAACAELTISGLRRQVSGLTVALVAERDRIEQFQGAVARAGAEAADEIGAALDRSTARATEMSDAIRRLERAGSSLRAERDALSDRLHRAGVHAGAAEEASRLERLRHDAALGAVISDGERSRAQLLVQLVTARQELSVVLDRLSAADAEHQRNMLDVQTLVAEREDLATQRDIAEGQRDELDAALRLAIIDRDAAETHYEEARQAVAQAVADRDDAQAERDAAVSSRDQAESARDASKESELSLSVALEQERTRAAQASAALAASEAALLGTLQALSASSSADRQRLHDELARVRQETEAAGEMLRAADDSLARRETELAERDAAVARRDTELEQRDAELAARVAELAQRDAELAQRDAELAERDAELAESHRVLSGREIDLARLVSGEARFASELASLSDRIAIGERVRAELRTERDTLAGTVDRLSREAAAHAAAAAATADAVESQQREHDGAVDRLQERMGRAERERDQLRALLASAASRVAELESARSEVLAERDRLADSLDAFRTSDRTLPPHLGVAEPIEVVIDVRAPAPELRSARPGASRRPLRAFGVRSSSDAPLGPDDLEQIPGVGPVLARTLHRLGVHTYRVIGEWTMADITRVQSMLPDDPGRIERDGWVVGARTCWSMKYDRPWADRSGVEDALVPDWALRLEAEGPLEMDLVGRLRVSAPHGERALVGAGSHAPRAAVSATRLGGGDDLQAIIGIGPRIEAALRGAGLISFVRIESAREHQLRDALASAGLTWAPTMSTWPAQAGFLSRGDLDGLRRYLTERGIGQTGEQLAR
jgi:predicted flap endonuclease-1-like 5' DNA nuclease/chromosome segregation ATPase